MRSAQLSISAPKLGISSNFFGGGLDKFSLPNGIFLERSKTTTTTGCKNVPFILFSLVLQVYIRDLHGITAVSYI